jgi:hypothetical protein
MPVVFIEEELSKLAGAQWFRDADAVVASLLR